MGEQQKREEEEEKRRLCKPIIYLIYTYKEQVTKKTNYEYDEKNYKTETTTTSK